VELEQVVDGAMKAPLRSGGVLAAQQLFGVLDGLHLSEDRFEAEAESSAWRQADRVAEQTQRRIGRAPDPRS
jgi:hypothetical protein